MAKSKPVSALGRVKLRDSEGDEVEIEEVVVKEMTDLVLRQSQSTWAIGDYLVNHPELTQQQLDGLACHFAYTSWRTLIQKRDVSYAFPEGTRNPNVSWHAHAEFFRITNTKERLKLFRSQPEWTGGDAKIAVNAYQRSRPGGGHPNLGRPASPSKQGLNNDGVQVHSELDGTLFTLTVDYPAAHIHSRVEGNRTIITMELVPIGS